MSQISLTKEETDLIWQGIAEQSTNVGDVLEAKMNSQIIKMKSNAQIMADVWVGAFKTIESGLANTIKAFIFGGKNIGNVWKQVGQDMLGSIIDAFIKIQMQALINSLFEKKLSQDHLKTTGVEAGARANMNATAFAAKFVPWPAAVAQGIVAEAYVLGIGAKAMASLFGGKDKAPAKAAEGSPIGGFGGGQPGVDSVHILAQPEEVVLDGNASDIFRSMAAGGGAMGGSSVNVTIVAMDARSFADNFDTMVKPAFIKAIRNDADVKRANAESLEGRV